MLRVDIEIFNLGFPGRNVLLCINDLIALEYSAKIAEENSYNLFYVNFISKIAV